MLNWDHNLAELVDRTKMDRSTITRKIVDEGASSKPIGGNPKDT